MRTGSRTALSLAVAALAAAAAFGGDNQLPATPAEALTQASPAIEAARKAKQAETPDIVKNIRHAVDLMQPQAKKGAQDAAWAAAWNEALTLSRFHGNKPTGEYAMQLQSAVRSSIEFGLPTGRNWSFEPKTPGKNEQCWGEITRLTGDGRKAAMVAISAYSFNVVYSDVGGENATGIAKMGMGYFREKFTKIDSGGMQILPKPFSKGFGRAQFFEIVGTAAEGPCRLRCYYAKTSLQAYEFEVWQYRDVAKTDAPVEAWQKSVEDPELEAVLESVQEQVPKKAK